MDSRYIYIICFIAVFVLIVNNSVYSQTDKINSDNLFDSVYAQKLGADDYGMKTYIMAFLKSGKVSSGNKAESDSLQMEHLKNIIKLAEEGVLVLAGPFMSNDQDLRGIYVFNVKTVEEARKLTETDPAIRAGILEMELIPWYGSAALMEVNNIQKRIQKISITDQ